MNRFVGFLFVIALPALANAGPLVTKTSGGGFTPPEWQRLESCQLFRDRAVIKHVYHTSDSRPIDLEREEKVSFTGAVADLLLAASKEKESHTQNGLCDAPETTVVAHLVGAPETDTGFILFQTGGCGSDRIERQGPATAALRDMIDQYCPLTYDNQPTH